MKRFDKWEYTCCFDVHVFTCTKIWAIFDIIISLTALILSILIFVPGPLPTSFNGWLNLLITYSTISYTNIIFIIRPLLIIIPNILVIYGVYRRNLFAFLPNLFVNGLILFVYPFLLAIDIINVVRHFDKNTNSQGMSAGGFFTFVFTLLVWFVFYKAYKYLREVKGYEIRVNSDRTRPAGQNTLPDLPGTVSTQPT